MSIKVADLNTATGTNAKASPPRPELGRRKSIVEKLSLISVVKEALKTKFRDLLQILEEKEKEDAEMWFNKDSDSETISTSSDQEHSMERSESSSDSQLQDLPRWQAAGFGDSARRSDSHRKQQAKFLREQKH